MQPEPEPLVEPQFSVPVTQRDIEPDRSELLHEPGADSIPVSQRVTEFVQEADLPGEPEEMQDVPTRKRRESTYNFTINVFYFLIFINLINY